MENLLKQIEGELSKFFDGGETGIDIEYMTSNSFTNEISHSLSLDELTVKCEIDENNKNEDNIVYRNNCKPDLIRITIKKRDK